MYIIKAHIGYAFCKRAFPAELSVSFYTIVPSSLFTLVPGAARHLFIAWPPKREKNPAFRPQYRTNLPSPRRPRAAPSPELIHMLGTCTFRKKSMPAIQYAKNPSYVSPRSILFISQAQCFSFASSYIPPAPFCTCVKYCLLVVFHAAMYFSMQLV
jgi:hypothetical protein